jgi:radical SAM superfamily enzyme YgiQ (UPF0313 family)
MKLLLTAIDAGCMKTRLAIKYLYAVVADAPIEVDHKLFADSMSNESIYEEIVGGEYDMVYFHITGSNEERTSSLIESVKKAMPASVTLAGGPEVSYGTPDYMKDHPMLDFAVRGEGETVLFNFIKTIVTRQLDFARIKGLAYREGRVIKINGFDEPVDPAELPFPYEREEVNEGDTVYYETFRGTPDRCIYSVVEPGGVRYMPLDRILTDLRYFIIKNVGEVRVLDKWFNHKPARAYRIFEFIINNDNGTTVYHFDINGDALDDETIRLLCTARKGMFEFDVDVDSTNAEVLANSGRKENIYQLLSNVRRLLAYGNVRIHTSLKVGMPGETAALFARSFNKVYPLGADEFTVDTLTLGKGCKLREFADEAGYVYSSSYPYNVIATYDMPASKLIRIGNVAKIADMYSKRGEFDDSIPRIMQDAGIRPFELFSRLTDYIAENELSRKVLKADDRYRVLYAFAGWLYNSIGESFKLKLLMEIMHSDIEKALSAEEVAEFDRAGWSLFGN